jgi:hypothetical protein
VTTLAERLGVPVEDVVAGWKLMARYREACEG